MDGIISDAEVPCLDGVFQEDAQRRDSSELHLHLCTTCMVSTNALNGAACTPRAPGLTRTSTIDLCSQMYDFRGSTR
eukprot:7834135-Prorocentrum_lima.AAC.1